MISKSPLDGPFGVAIRGVDLKSGIDDRTLRELADALYEHRVIVLKDQTCDKDEYLAFGRLWGNPIPHVLDHLRMPGYPEMMEVGNIHEIHRKDEVRNGAAFWHTDQSYEAEPSSATMLYARKAPKVGGETMLADMVAAYEALDETEKEAIDGLKVAHLYGAASGRDGEKIASPIINDDQASKVPQVYHPLVRPHPVTGVKSLYAVAGTPCGIEGMEADEAAALLERLKRHALSERFIYRHKYAVGDIAIYDTASTLHSGTPIEFADTPEQARLLWRISVRGRPRAVH